MTVDFKSTPLEPLAFQARVVQYSLFTLRRVTQSAAETDAPSAAYFLAGN